QSWNETCYVCARRGHIKRDCPYGAGGRVPHPKLGRRPVPQTARWVREPRRLRACWVCGRRGHLWQDCPAPRNTIQGNPGRVGSVRDNGKKQEARATPRRGACWHCWELGHLRKDCPLGGEATQLEAAKRCFSYQETATAPNSSN
uniref:CCHC-type domain-containing protein n=1 Tax=Terrapene triunguis TaxID=2587831 RepID=A0A674IHS9_9SAUR